jgi:UDP-N-acetylmuramoyl-L-alanyl-D-glutamate--2,6-diaminopimelate ligase
MGMEESMQLASLLRQVTFHDGLQILTPEGQSLENFTVGGIGLDSRKVSADYIFIAVSGTHANGLKFIPDAVSKGATIIVCDSVEAEQVASQYPKLCVLGVAHLRRFTAALAQAFYERAPETIVAVTGTNGKTSVAEFTRQLWEGLGYAAASVGTLGILSKNWRQPKNLTTPDPISLFRDFREMVDHHITHVAMEASSHGLNQHRLDGMPLQAAGFTNLSHDHLEYHGTMEAYLNAKLRLFKELLPLEGIAVINADIPEYEAVCTAAGRRDIISYGKTAKEIVLESLKPLPHGQQVHLTVFGKPYDITLNLIGAFQVYNILCALGLVLACDRGRQDALLAVLPRLKGVSGRVELAGTKANGAAVYIDYAHASDGLATLLQSLRPHTQHKLAIVFGAGGGRDSSTRALMGQVVQQFADYVIVTDDNPRFEEPAVIRQQILSTCPKAQEIPDREEAIKRAIDDLGSGDILVIAGKGPENGQIVNGVTHPFDDKAVAQKFLRASA